MRALLIVIVFGLIFLFPAQALEAPTQRLTPEQVQQVSPLNGQWKLINPEGQSLLVEVPNPWERNYSRKYLPHYGKGVYELKLDLPATAVGKYFKLFTQLIGGESFRFYVDGQLRGHNGFRLGSTSRLVQFSPFLIEQQQLNLRFEIDNHLINISGLTQSVLFGPADQIENLQIKNKIGLNLAVGVIFFLGLFHLLLFAGFRQDKALLWFALFCLAGASFCEFYQVRNLEYFLGEIPSYLATCFVRLSLYLIFPCYFFYLAAVAPLIPSKVFLSKRFLNLSLGVSVIGCLSLLMPMGARALGLMFVMSMYSVLLIYSFYRLKIFIGQPKSYFFVLSTLCFSVTVLNDVFNGLGVLANGNVSRYGVMLFCLLQAALLALRLKSSYQHAVDLQFELQEVNQNLEGLVSSRTQEVQSKNAELLQLVKFKDEMTQMIVHDLKTPLNTLMHLPSQQIGLSESSRNSFESASQRILALVDNMLQLKRTDNPELELRLSPQSLRQLSENILLSVQNWAGSKKIKLYNQVDPELVILADAVLLERVLLNLCDNAIKHTPIGGKIILSSRLLTDHVELLIEDTGHGLNPEIIARVFDKHQSFAQGQTPQSSGLGLHFCRQVVEAHGGKIQLENRQPSGARVMMTFPLASGQSADPILPGLAYDDILLLRPLAEQLGRLDVFEVSDIYALLAQTKAPNNPNVQLWRKQLEQAVHEVNEENYAKLLSQITPTVDC